MLKQAQILHILDCNLQIDADPDPAYQFAADPDPVYHFEGSGAWCSKVPVGCVAVKWGVVQQSKASRRRSKVGYVAAKWAVV